MPLYQLSIPPGCRPHVPFVYFSNGPCAADQRLTVVVTHHKLDTTSTQLWCEKIVRYNGGDTAALGRRSLSSFAPRDRATGDYRDVHLEYMRFCIIWHGREPPRVVCMDTLCDVRGISEANLQACRVQADNLVVAPTGSAPGMMSTVPLPSSSASPPDSAVRHRTLSFPTSTHGDVTVQLSVFRNPDVRNGIEIRPQRNVSIDTAWGATVKAVNPRRFLLPRMLRRPPPLPTGLQTIKDTNTSSFFVPRTGHFVTDPTVQRTMLVPAGGHGQAYRMVITDKDVADDSQRTPTRTPT